MREHAKSFNVVFAIAVALVVFWDSKIAASSINDQPNFIR